MKFNHAGVSYRVKFTPDDIYNDDGVKCWGISDPNENVILLDARMSEEHAERVLFHELAHAWKDITDFDASDDEILAVHMGSFVSWIFSEYQKQGGRRRLKRMLVVGRMKGPFSGLALPRLLGTNV